LDEILSFFQELAVSDASHIETYLGETISIAGSLDRGAIASGLAFVESPVRIFCVKLHGIMAWIWHPLGWWAIRIWTSSAPAMLVAGAFSSPAPLQLRR
jgi:hypothetical protein